MMLSVGKIFWLLIILVSVWYVFKIIEKRKLNFRNKNENKSDANRKGIDAFKSVYYTHLRAHETDRYLV
mgnify:CR=1 FL=1